MGYVILCIMLFILSVFYVKKYMTVKAENLVLSVKVDTLKTNLDELQVVNREVLCSLDTLNKQYDTLLSQKKSSETRLGMVGEHLAPFLNDWPYESNRFRFIGDPIDGVQFGEDEIVFVEIKTGKSKLSNGQRLCKELIKAGKVSFVTFRISEDGCTLKKEN